MVEKANASKTDKIAAAKLKLKQQRSQLQQNSRQKHRMLALVQEYVRQRPEATVQVLTRWIKTS